MNKIFSPISNFFFVPWPLNWISFKKTHRIWRKFSTQFETIITFNAHEHSTNSWKCIRAAYADATDASLDYRNHGYDHCCAKQQMRSGFVRFVQHSSCDLQGILHTCCCADSDAKRISTCQGCVCMCVCVLRSHVCPIIIINYYYYTSNYFYCIATIVQKSELSFVRKKISKQIPSIKIASC